MAQKPITIQKGFLIRTIRASKNQALYIPCSQHPNFNLLTSLSARLVKLFTNERQHKQAAKSQNIYADVNIHITYVNIHKTYALTASVTKVYMWKN